MQIQPGLDRYYYIGIVDDPAGVVETTRYQTSGSQTSDYTEVKTFEDKIKFTAIFAKNFYDLTLKGGLIESKGGVGMDYYFMRRKLRATVEAFGFDKTNLRAGLAYSFYRGLYLSGGINDALNKNSSQSGYLGAGILLTNDDLKLAVTRLAF